MKKIYKYTAVILYAAMIFPFLAATFSVHNTAFAAETYTEGIFTYSVTDGEATITKIQPDDEATELVIPSTLGGYPVTTIGARAVIGYTSQIKTVTVSEGITTILATPFAGLLQAEELHLPASLTVLAYMGISTQPWKNITVPEESTFLTVADGALLSKDKTILYRYITDETANVYTIPPTVKTIKEYAFTKAENLEQVVFSENLETIGYCAFSNCTGITKPFHITEKVRTIEEGALFTSSSFDTFTVDENNPYFTQEDGILYSKDKSVLVETPSGKILGDFVIPDFVNETAESVFHYTNQLTSITYHENIVKVDISYVIAITDLSIYILNREAEIIHGIFYPAVSKTTLYGYKGSTTESFAAEYGVTFIALDAEEENPEEDTTTEDTTTPEEPAPPFSTSYKQGDIIEFGSYPQTLVTDETLIEELGWYIEDDMWQSLGWYRGTGAADSMYETDAGKYCDIEYYGEKYRAVTFSEHRAYETFKQPTSSYQAPLGYTPDNIYFFKYEPIKWRILDPTNGLLLAETVLDAPAFSNNAYQTNSDESLYAYYYYSDTEHTRYCSNWEYSSLREFLNNTFYATAFTSLEQTLLGEVELENKVTINGDEKYNGNNTTDKVFILSANEIGYDEYYGLSDELRKKNGSDYAHMHGLFSGTADAGAAAQYYLRNPASSSTVTYVSEKGVISTGVNAYSQDVGVVPALCMDLETFDRLDLYDGINISFDNGVLTVSGSGILPDRTASVTDILAPYAETTTAVIIKDGITEISENAFKGFIEMKSLILEGKTTLKNNSLPDSFQLSTVVFKDEITLEGNPFAPDIYYINIFVKYGLSYTYEYFPEGVTTYTYAFKDGNIEINGNVTMNTYEFFDFMAVMCGDYEGVETVSFNEFTSTDLRFYTYDGKTGKKIPVPDSTVSNAVFSVEISTDGNIEKVTFNTLCEMAAKGTLDEFYLITQSATQGDIADTEMEINSIEDLITYALKWIVSLLNYFFSLFSRFR